MLIIKDIFLKATIGQYVPQALLYIAIAGCAQATKQFPFQSGLFFKKLLLWQQPVKVIRRKIKPLRPPKLVKPEPQKSFYQR